MGRKGGKKPDQPAGQQPQQKGARESAFDFAGKDAALLEHLQGRLGSLVGRSSGYLETLPQQIQTRIKGLKHLHGKHVELEKQFNSEVAELEKKYMALYKPLYERRSAIVSGASEPTEEELLAKEEEKTEEEKKEAAPSTDAKGVPEFWLTALKHHPDFGSMISERDEEALKSLTEIKVTSVENEPHSFSVEFHFADNEFFEDKIVKKTYVLKEQPEDSEVVYDHVDATEIKWKPGKDLTRKKVTKTQKAKGGRRGGRGGASAKPQTITVEQPCESFFNFFNPEAAFEIAMGEYQEEDDDELAEQGFQEFLEMDYELGLEFKDKLVPHAVVWFTGEAAIGLGLGEEDFDDEEFDEEDDDDEENEADYAPPTKSEGNQQQPECKQQ